MRPQLQYFRFNKLPSNIQIEILDVYKGDRWDDTCINNIFPYGWYYSLMIENAKTAYN
jgi:hypothetical protein